MLMSDQPDGVEKLLGIGPERLMRQKNVRLEALQMSNLSMGHLSLRLYLEGQSFTIPTDHDASRWIFRLAHLLRRLAT